MLQKIKVCAAIGTMLLATGVVACAQQKPASPPGKAEVTLKGQQVTITYGRPSMRGRKIFGGLVPYGQRWRTGANESTTLTTGTDFDIGGANVPAGKYTLDTIPSEGTWKLIINKQTGQWGTEYNQGQDLARVDMQKSKLEQPVEEFTISFDKKGPDSADLVLEWENTRVWVPVKAK